MIVRLLVLSNLYPPHSIGGYELACRDVVRGLRLRGHHVVVFTSYHGLSRPQAGAQVKRLLKRTSRRSTETRSIAAKIGIRLASRAEQALGSVWNAAIMLQAVLEAKPDAVLVFNAESLGVLTLEWLHATSIPVAHDISDLSLIDIYWLNENHAGASGIVRLSRGRKLERRAVGALLTCLRGRRRRLDLSRSYYRSSFLRTRLAEAGLASGGEPVIYHGVEPPSTDQGDAAPAARGGIVFSGRLVVEKGPHVLLEALTSLIPGPAVSGQRVTIIGPEHDAAYACRLHQLAAHLAPAVEVDFVGVLPREQATDLVRMHSIFVFPVLWEEPFSIVLLEALRDGLAVIATLTGGSGEILRHEYNCLVVPPNDAPALALAMRRLLDDKGLRHRLSVNAAASVRELTVDASISAIETHLRRVTQPAAERQAYKSR